jgi:hypothetical protein
MELAKEIIGLAIAIAQLLLIGFQIRENRVAPKKKHFTTGIRNFI